jgi:CubicO group peptidase (beta-lactamase class C family)
VEGACATNLLFEPGTRVSYQSMGTALLGEVLQRITGQPLPDFLRREFFDPLGMNDTSLGWQPEKRHRIAAVRLPANMEHTDWHWNTPYWLGFGAPWGGLVTSPADYAKFCQLMLNGGAVGGVRVLSPATVRAMTSNQLAGMPRMPEEERRCRPWGLGWRLHWPAHSPHFGDLLGPRSFGHWGATGTLCWMDPDTEVFCVILTTQPQEEEGRFLARACNAVAAAVV